MGTLGPYRVVKKLGQGGMGAVYAAIDTRLDRKLALKVMLPDQANDSDARERFLREARSAARIKHDNVVTLYEADERNGVPYIAMEFLEGYPLDEYLKKKGGPSVQQVLRIGAETAAGLAAAHKLGMVHRDIKPANLWLEAPNGRVKILDFGLAKPIHAESQLTLSGAVVGTPAYMSPEQARGGKLDHRSDLFSLGGVLYRLCTGRLPFEGPNTMAILMALGTEEPKPVRDLNPDVPQPLAELIHRLLAKSADARPQTAEELVKLLRAVAQGPKAKADPPPLAQPVPLVGLPVRTAPIEVTAMPEGNPFAEIDEATEVVPARSAAKPRVRKPTGSNKPWAIGLGVLGALLLGFTVIKITNKDGSVTEIKVPDEAKIEINQGPKEKNKPMIPRVTSKDPDRKAAEYVLSIGGSIRIDSSNRELKSAVELPKERFMLIDVYVNGCSVTDVGLANFKDCSRLRSLFIDNTKVTDTGLAFLKDCKGLKSIGLSGTLVTDSGLDHLKGLIQIQELFIPGTAVTDVGLANFKDCEELTTLHLQGTRVTDMGLANFKDCKTLTTLNLESTEVTDAGLDHFKNYQSLLYLDLNGTKVTDEGLSKLKDCTSLRHVHLVGTVITDPGLTLLHGLSNLEMLEIRNCKKLTDASLIALKKLTTLRYLNMTNVAVTDAGLSHLKELTQLSNLYLDSTGVTDAGLENLLGLANLSELGLTKTKVTEAGVKKLKAALPRCAISWEGGTLPAIDADRKAAEWVLSVGGSVMLNGKQQIIKAIADLPKERFVLTFVNLGQNNAVSDAGLKNLKDCKDLKILELGSSRTITDEGLAHFKGCKSLTELNLDDSVKVTDVGLANFKDCKKLTHLIISRTGLTDNGLANFRNLPDLNVLMLSGTKVTDDGLAQFKDCKNLTQLHLWLTGVTDAGLAHFKGCKKLSTLDLKESKVRDSGLADLKDFERLKVLILTGTAVTDSGLKHLQHCKSLKELYLRTTQVTAKGLADFHAAVPGCKIEHDGGVIEPKALIDPERKAAK